MKYFFFTFYLGKQKQIVKIGGIFEGFRTLTIRTCHDLEIEFFETDADGKSVLLTKSEVTGIKENCMVGTEIGTEIETLQFRFHDLFILKRFIRWT